MPKVNSMELRRDAHVRVWNLETFIFTDKGDTPGQHEDPTLHMIFPILTHMDTVRMKRRAGAILHNLKLKARSGIQYSPVLIQTRSW
jgi:hypothetical protein